ncbi:TPA: TIGR03751 family conjugal transfer lipoprotein, partial [Pseudomonas aeruginosa]
MPRIWIDAAAVLLAATLLGGCATSKEKLLPHGDSTMLDIWHQETGGSPGGG